ncbi:hypothetical protein (plasmid) [Enterobacter hormaechei subsp. steigerwaltii]|uniref:Uncharacterized protein n=5 Tax=Enterobacteriaceae TaxID=543 RepID=A0A142CPT1_ECOLX|nr:hypothetical protein [Enterobacter cloacae]ALP55242.1 hypothetical protein KPH11_222 [Klebsiella pneumoniae subsp. pneumoniae]AMQ12576.1 hypothetical protein [Escherichia coli]AQT23847.1 hypothetical protein [Salmonella enterica subsp. enterica serovar Enteritidis]UOL52429.1 hypothetical protein [Enterobacter hormaechei subsp. steigerwaltii]WGO49155.1 hypothetical protein [Citrobacter freundii]BDH21662.1 conjugal transfer protein [Salmonella enterica subsp. enterica serovar Typhimurium]
MLTKCEAIKKKPKSSPSQRWIRITTSFTDRHKLTFLLFINLMLT